MAFRSGSTGSTASGNVSVTVPTGVQANDIVLLFVNRDDNTDTPTWPSGFTQLSNTHVSSSDGQSMQCAWKRLTGADTGSYTVTSTSSWTASASAVAFSGRDTTNPPVLATPGTSTSSGTNQTLSVSSGVTAVAGDDLVFAMLPDPNGVTGFTAPTGYTQMTVVTNGTNQNATQTSRKENVSAGATGSVSGTVTGSTFGWAAFLIRIPAAAASGSTASGSLSLSGSAAASTSASASLSLSGTATESSVATGALALSGSGTGGPTATGSLTLGGSATGGADATAAGSLSLTGSASSGTDTVISQPGNSGSFFKMGDSFTAQIAQQFTATASKSVYKATAGLVKIGSPTDNFYLTITTDSPGAPTATVLGTSDNVAASSISTTLSDVLFTFTTNVAVTNGAKYWLVINRTGAASSTDTVEWYYDNTNPYSGGAASIGDNSNGWVLESGVDLEFSVTSHTAPANGASGSLSLSGSGAWAASATGAVTLAATAAESSVANASITLGGSGTGSTRATGSVTLAGTAAWATSAAGSVTLGGSAIAMANATGSGSVSLSGVQSSGPSGAGSITLAGTATRASDVASGSLSLVGSTYAASSASGAVTLTATGAWRDPAAGSITLGGTATRATDNATGALTLSGVVTTGGNSATGAIALSETAGARQVAAGSVALSASGKWQITVTSSVTLAGAGGAVARATTTGTLSLTGTAFVGVLKNYIHGSASVGRGGGASVKASGGAKIGSGSGGASIK